MNRRFLNGCVCLLYLSVALVLGVCHDHHEHHDHACDADGHDDDCVACQWQLNAITDAPVVVIPVTTSVSICFTAVPAYVPAIAETPFQFSTASRAPPEALV